MDRIPSQKTSSISQKNRILSHNQSVSSKADPISGFSNLLKAKPKSKSSSSRSKSGTSSSWINLGKKSATIQHTKSSTFDLEDSQDPFGSEDPFAFDEEEEEPSKWDLMSGKNNVSQSQKSSSVVELDEDEQSKWDLMVLSQQESSNVEHHDSTQVSCSRVDDDAKFNLLADCLLASVKVIFLSSIFSYFGLSLLLFIFLDF